MANDAAVTASAWSDAAPAPEEGGSPVSGQANVSSISLNVLPVGNVASNEDLDMHLWFAQAIPDMPQDDINCAVDVLKKLGISTLQHMKSIAKQDYDFRSLLYRDFIENGGTVYIGRMWMLALKKLGELEAHQ